MIIKKSFSHFFNISLGSSFELQTQILLANHRKYLSDYLKVSKK
ncbi:MULTISPECIES: four helix bundle protein [unclassified Chryseobacterium]|nr:MULTISPECIES: four helix bundle protein [unclassified Chryseobacterium]MEA1849151.1 four helix bundle protein [Chryseobacterium sp. MHB01]